MSSSNFIPAGKTSLVEKGNASLQVQTEYAYRPYPRITTTILNNGQLLHKIEKKLTRSIESFEEQSKIEEIMKKQHSEILSIIDNESFVPDAIEDAKEETSGKFISINDRLQSIPGVQKVYQLDIDGNFLNNSCSEQFKNAFSAIFKNIKELIEVFSMMPNAAMTREKGVYEIERNRLYLVSCGDELYFVMVKSDNTDIVYEKVIKETLDEVFKEF